MKQPVDGLSADFIADALCLPVASEWYDTVFTGITSDSRSDVAGQLFVAIDGERFDGHDFIAAAINAGARGVIAERCDAQHRNPSVVWFVVEDSIMAWRRIAAAWRRRFHLPIIAIGGAAGKTTTKDMLAALLRGRFTSVLSTIGSRNGYLGLAMTLSELRAHHQAAVVEIGIDAPDAMDWHAALVEPDVAVTTTIGPEHLDTLKNVSIAAYEESRLLVFTIARGGVVAVNNADTGLAPFVRGFEDAQCIRYQLTDTPYDGAGLSACIDGDRLVLNGQGFENAAVALPLPGRHNALNLLSAVAIARHLGLTLADIRRGLARFKPDEMRSHVHTLKTGVTLFSDYYNASPLSVRAALDTMRELAGERYWLVLGDMLELGEDELLWHRQLAEPIMALPTTGVFLYGARMQSLYDQLRKMNYSGELALFENKTLLAQNLSSKLSRGDIVLVKGSRGMGMETIVSELEAHCCRTLSSGPVVTDGNEL